MWVVLTLRTTVLFGPQWYSKVLSSSPLHREVNATLTLKDLCVLKTNDVHK